jgi:hypothetical protein
LTLSQWATNNKSLLLVRDVNAAVLTQDINSGKSSEIYTFPKEVHSPVVLPSVGANRLVFVGIETSSMNLYLVALETSKLTKLVGNLDPLLVKHTESPDGKYMTVIDRQNQVFFINLQSGEVHPLTIDEVGLTFVWSPDSHYVLTCYLAPGGQPGQQQGGALLMSVDSPDKPTKLWNQPVCPQVWVP